MDTPLRFLLLGLAAALVSSLKMSGGRRRALKAEERALRLREAEAFATQCQTAEAELPSIGLAQPSPANSDADHAAPWMQPIKKALNHGGTQRSKRDRSEAKRKQLQLATVDPATGFPSVRTVVFRGFLPSHLAGELASPVKNGESCLLTFITDTRSEKVRHITAAQPAAAPVECCWWLDEANVQFRITGHAVLATPDSDDAALRTACSAVWDRLGSSTRATFSAPHAVQISPALPLPPCRSQARTSRRDAAWPNPGEPTKASQASEPRPEGAEGRGKQKAEVALEDAHFCVVIVKPHRVDELHLGGKQRRTLYTLQAGAEAGLGGRGAGAGGELALPGTGWRMEEVNP